MVIPHLLNRMNKEYESDEAMVQEIEDKIKLIGLS